MKIFIAFCAVLLAQNACAMFLLPNSRTISPLLEDTESPGNPSSDATTPYPRSLLIEDEDGNLQTDSPLLSDLDEESQLLIRREGWKKPAPSMDMAVYRAISNNLMDGNMPPHQRPQTGAKPCDSRPETEVLDLSAKSQEESTTVKATENEPEIVFSLPLHPRHGYKKKKETTNNKPKAEIQSDQAIHGRNSQKIVEENNMTYEDSKQQSNDSLKNYNNKQKNDSGEEDKENNQNDKYENSLGKESTEINKEHKHKNDLAKQDDMINKVNDQNDNDKNDSGKEGKKINIEDIQINKHENDLGKEGKEDDQNYLDDNIEDDDYNDVELTRSMGGPFVYILELIGSFLQLVLGVFGSLSSGSRNYPTIGTRGIGK